MKCARLENTSPPVRTEMFLAHDDKNLYVAFKAYDDNPGSIRARFTDRDNISSTTSLRALDSFNDERRATSSSPSLGVQSDSSWTMSPETRTQPGMPFGNPWTDHPTGFEVEMVIRSRSFVFRPPMVRRPGSTAFAAIRGDKHHIGCFRAFAARTATLARSEDHRLLRRAAGSNLEIVPTLTALRAETQVPGTQPANVRSDGDGAVGQVGRDAERDAQRHRHPDFSQVEADAVQPMSQPVRLVLQRTRPFFLEGSDLFRPRA